MSRSLTTHAHVPFASRSRIHSTKRLRSFSTTAGTRLRKVNRKRSNSKSRLAFLRNFTPRSVVLVDVIHGTHLENRPLQRRSNGGTLTSDAAFNLT
jgi:hypothetical protein